MSTVLAAIDDSAAASPVLATAQAVADLWNARVEAMNVSDDGGQTAGAAAHAAGVSMRVKSGDPARCLADAAAAPDVVAVVIGARGRPGGRRPAGHVALELLTRCDKPLIVVPPDAPARGVLHRIVVALEGTAETSRVLRPAMDLGRSKDLDVTVVHVDDEASIPQFSDQPQHETDAFADEFLARYGPSDHQPPPLQLRVGEPAEEVLAVCDETTTDMLVVAWSRTLEPGRARFVRHILEHARIPVLLLPIRER